MRGGVDQAAQVGLLHMRVTFELSFLWRSLQHRFDNIAVRASLVAQIHAVPACCRVTEVAPPAITLAPHPDAAVHPLSYQRALRRALRLQAAAAAGDEEAEAEEDSDDEGGLGCC